MTHLTKSEIFDEGFLDITLQVMDDEIETLLQWSLNNKDKFSEDIKNLREVFNALVEKSRTGGGK